MHWFIIISIIIIGVLVTIRRRRAGKKPYEAITHNPKEFLRILTNCNERVSKRRRLISKYIIMQDKDTFDRQTKASFSSKYSFSSILTIIESSQYRTDKRVLPAGGLGGGGGNDGGEETVDGLVRDLSLLPVGELGENGGCTGEDILYCALVKFGGKYYRYIGVTRHYIGKRWGYRYQSSHLVHMHAVWSGSAAFSREGKEKSRDFRYLMMAFAEQITVVYKKFSAVLFSRRLMAYLSTNRPELVRVLRADPLYETRELAEAMLIRQHSTHYELNELAPSCSYPIPLESFLSDQSTQ